MIQDGSQNSCHMVKNFLELAIIDLLQVRQRPDRLWQLFKRAIGHT